MADFIMGAITMASFTISLFFLRFWCTTRDRFFIFFALSFACEGSIRLILGLTNTPDEWRPLVYLVRLLAYILIIIAIIDKNLLGKDGSKP